MTILLISLSLIILVSGYFFISDYFQLFKKASDEGSSKETTPVVEETSVKPSKKVKKAKTKKEKVTKVETPQVTKKVANKVSKKDTFKTPEAQTLKTKRGRKKKS